MFLRWFSSQNTHFEDKKDNILEILTKHFPRNLITYYVIIWAIDKYIQSKYYPTIKISSVSEYMNFNNKPNITRQFNIYKKKKMLLERTCNQSRIWILNIVQYAFLESNKNLKKKGLFHQ